LKVIYKITFPTGKIYIGKDATDTLHYYGSVDSSCLESDFSNDLRDHFSIKKELLWKSDTVSDKELSEKEIEYIQLYGSNNPKIGYNRWPKDKSEESKSQGIAYLEGIHFSLAEIVPLYLQAGWKAYTDNPETLWRGITNSLCIIGAYEGSALVGFIRIVGDGETIIYIQDLIVENEHRNQGIGSSLVQKALAKYEGVRQKVLVCDNDEALLHFYALNGFKEVKRLGMKALGIMGPI